MIQETNQSESFQQLISVLYLGNHIRWNDQNMDLSYTRTAPYSNNLHPNKDTQTDPSGETYCIREWQPSCNKETIFRLYPSARSTTTEVICERYDALHQFLRENKGSRKHNPCFCGHYELKYKYTRTGPGINVPVPSQLKRIEKRFNSNNYLERNTLTQLL